MKRRSTLPGILVFAQSDGTWGYAPELAMRDTRMARSFRFSDKPGLPTKDAAIADARQHGLPVRVETAVEFFQARGFTYEHPGHLLKRVSGYYDVTIGDGSGGCDHQLPIDAPLFSVQVMTGAGANTGFNCDCTSVEGVLAYIELVSATTQRLYYQEFPDFALLPFDPEQHGLHDTSWHNDVCPSFSLVVNDVNVETLWIDYEKPQHREMAEVHKRFVYQTYDPAGEHNEPLATLLDTDDAAQAEAFIKARNEGRKA